MNRFTLPIRRWLALALIATFFLPFMVTGIVVAGQARHQHVDSAALRQLSRGAPRWDNLVWRSSTQSALAARGVNFVLIEGGREVYRTPGAATGAAAQNQWWGGPAQTEQTLVVPGSHPRKVAYIYTDSQRGAGPSWLMYPLVYLSTLVLTLGVIAWLLGRTVLRPLAATSRAARQIAGGDLAIELPPSQVREVAEVGAAFEAMSRALQESLRQQAQLEEERRFFVGAIAHDLRTPLFSLRGYLEGMEEGIADTAAKKMHYLEVAQEKATALERLVSDLFAYTRTEYLEQTLHRAPLDLDMLLHNAVEGRRAEAEAKGVKLELEGPRQVCMVDGDEHLLGRAVENLLDNAFQQTPPAGKIVVARRPEADGMIFTVVDSGAGIAGADLPHLFDPLFRSDSSRNPRSGGVGLGLTIARRILRAHGGELTAANAPTGGAVFTAVLPAAATVAMSPKPVGASM